MTLKRICMGSSTWAHGVMLAPQVVKMTSTAEVEAIARAVLHKVGGAE